jgi:hypothetical protein
MVMFVGYPWLVRSAYVELTGPQPDHAVASHRDDAPEDALDQRAKHLEGLVSWTERERLRLQWYRLRLAISDLLRG